MIDRLEQLIEDVAALHSKLVLIIGAAGSGKSKLLAELARRRAVSVLEVGSALGRRLATQPVKQRALQAPGILRELVDEHGMGDLLLLDNIELLFDSTLQLDPLDLMRQLARARRVVAAWPGELRHGHLVYAEIGHPEHRDYGLDGIVPFEIQE